MSNLELNQGDNFIFAIDVSGSMETKDCPGDLSRINYLKEKVIAFANEAAKYDPDGIDVLTFGHTVTHYPGIDDARAKEVIGRLRANEGATNTHSVIADAYRLHKDGGYKQTVLFVATDGSPSVPHLVKEVILDISKKLGDEHEFAISFLTVGEVDTGLQYFLDSLDDLKGAPHDIVDVRKLEEVDFMTAFIGALHD